MRIALVDDEQSQRDMLKSYLSRFSEEGGEKFDVDEFPSGDALLANYRLIYDIIFLDVDMPGTNGVSAARRVRELDRSVAILFITNMAQYAINGYEVEALDYIIKPIGYYDFAMKFRRAVSRAARRRDRELLLDTAEGKVLVRVADVAYVETMGHYLIYHAVGKDAPLRELRVRGNMKDQEQLLRPYNFCQVHKSFLVNLEYVEEIGGNTLTAADTVLPVGRTYKDRLVQEYLRFVRG